MYTKELLFMAFYLFNGMLVPLSLRDVKVWKESISQRAKLVRLPGEGGPTDLRLLNSFYRANQWAPRPANRGKIVIIERGKEKIKDMMKIPAAQKRRSYSKELTQAKSTLSNLGVPFEVLRLEELPFHIQVESFANAKGIIAGHGGALSNTVFCMKCRWILEIFGAIHKKKMINWFKHHRTFLQESMETQWYQFGPWLNKSFVNYLKQFLAD